MIDWSKYVERVERSIFICKDCGKEFSKKDYAKEHIFLCHCIDINLFTCKKCNRTFIKSIPEQKVCGNPKCLLSN